MTTSGEAAGGRAVGLDTDDVFSLLPESLCFGGALQGPTQKTWLVAPSRFHHDPVWPPAQHYCGCSGVGQGG